MGCTSGKNNSEYQEYKQMLQKLISSFDSIEQYIQSQRSSAFSYLANNENVEVKLENSSDRSSLNSFTRDIELFKKYKKINKYKYEITFTKFLKNIKFCAYRMQIASDMYSQFFDKINQFKISEKGQQYIKKNEEQLQKVQQQMQNLSLYLQMSKFLDDESKAFSNSDLKTMNQTASSSVLEFEVQKSS